MTPAILSASDAQAIADRAASPILQIGVEWRQLIERVELDRPASALRRPSAYRRRSNGASARSARA